jgi:hypothetical protein
MIICTIYSHHVNLEKIKEIVKQVYPKSTLTGTGEGESQIFEIEIKGGLFGSNKRIKIPYRQRNQPSYQIPEIDDSNLTRNLKGMYGLVTSIQPQNAKIKEQLLRKIETLNCEFSIIQEQGETKEIKQFIQQIAQALDAILFITPNPVVSKSTSQHFLDKDLNLILDLQGNGEIENLEVKIDSKYYDGDQTALSQDQLDRKNRSEQLIESLGVTLNKNLPCIESEAEVNTRLPTEIAQRVTVLAMTNLVAFSTISNTEATEYLQENNLYHLVTPFEKDFLNDPTDEKKNHESWKCEGIWTLLWALNKVNELGLPNELCSLDKVPPENYPVGPAKNPNDFIQACTTMRSKKEILDANDLYYRLDWACVDARIHGKQIVEVNPSVVYERHYALNWLIHYMDQDWDEISCDT